MKHTTSDEGQSYLYGQILFRNIAPDDLKGLLKPSQQPYTITSSETERTYDEPCVDLPRSRSWLCCPGSRPAIQQPPPLLSPTRERTIETVVKPPTPCSCSQVCERVQQQLEEQAQRYEEQLTELHSVIAELTRKLHQQRAMAITEEDEVSEVGTSGHEDSITCPLEVSELEPLENELSDTETKLALAESPSELPDPKLNSSQHEPTEPSPENDDDDDENETDNLRSEIQMLKSQLAEARSRIVVVQATTSPGESTGSALFLSDEKLDARLSEIVPVHKAGSGTFTTPPVAKMAERVRLKRAAEEDRLVSAAELINSGLSTAVAEHLVGDILRQCDQPEKQAADNELRRLAAKLEHSKAQNAVLSMTLSDTKEHCDRLALLCGKYESNAVALRLALGITDRAVEAYDVLLALLETELADTTAPAEDRAAAEAAARLLLAHLDAHRKQGAEVLLSPWQRGLELERPPSDEPWSPEHEARLRAHVSRLKRERSAVQGTCVTLEAPHHEPLPSRPASTQEARKNDLEMAVLVQELMGLREDKAELAARLFAADKEREAAELRLKCVESQQRAQAAALKNIQGQLKDTEALLALATHQQGYSDADHAQGVELELVQALARESRLKVRLQELVATLEQVTKNAEARLMEGRELVHDLNQTNSVLVETVDRNYRKYQSRLKKMEHQMLTLVERHAAQVQTLKQRIAVLETPHLQINSSGNSETSL